jgi:hypothetical protein
MLAYSWFVFITMGGTVLALLLSLLSRSLREWPWSNRVGCAFSGAALGSFGSALLVLAYAQLASGIVLYTVPLFISAVFGFGLQKAVNEERFLFFPLE